MSTVNRRDFTTRPQAPLAIDQLAKEAALDPVAVRQADRHGDGRIAGQLASPEARRLSPVDDRVCDMVFRFVDEGKPTSAPPTDFMSTR
jgi:hypothetical protein